MSRNRGLNLQNGLARYLQSWWPSAESAGAGRPGTDILGTPGVVWENKTADEFSPLAFVRQAQAHAKPKLCPEGCGCRQGTEDADAKECGCNGPCCGPADGQEHAEWYSQWYGQHPLPDGIPVVVYWPRGVGEVNAGNTLAIVPLKVMVRLLKEAGY